MRSPGSGCSTQALALDLRHPQDYYHRLWSLSFRPADLAAATASGHTDEGEGG